MEYVPVLSELKENLLKAGQDEGCLSFSDLNELLPDEIKDPNAIESIFNFLGDNNIQIVTIEKSGEKRTLSGELWDHDKADLEDESDLADGSIMTASDIVHEAEETTTTYLREMGQFDLLTPDDEAKYSKSIRQGFDAIIEAIREDISGVCLKLPCSVPGLISGKSAIPLLKPKKQQLNFMRHSVIAARQEVFRQARTA